MTTRLNWDQATKVLEFYTAEALQVHALCDRVNVPRTVGGVEMSMSQRVTIMTGVLEEQLKKVGMARTMQ